MKGILKRVLSLLCCAGVAVGAVKFGPAVCMRLFGPGNTQWISERFTETLHEKNEFVVYEIETTGQETVTQDAWLIGTVQKVVLPYTFRMSFTVDLSKAEMIVFENQIELHIPSPKPGYQKLIVDEANMQKMDWLYPLTPERYAEIIKQVEEKIFTDYSKNVDYQNAAWDVTVRNLESLFQSVAEQSIFGQTCEIVIVCDDLLQ